MVIKFVNYILEDFHDQMQNFLFEYIHLSKKKKLIKKIVLQSLDK